MSVMTFSFNPAQINDGGLNQMRFELGDVMIAEPEKDAYLCDEEYLAALAGSRSFKHAKLRLVETLLMRFAYEVTTEAHMIKWEFSDRYKFWKDLYSRLKAEIELEELNRQSFIGRKFPLPIFRIGMNDWR